jgi:hypothetical protein
MSGNTSTARVQRAPSARHAREQRADVGRRAHVPGDEPAIAHAQHHVAIVSEREACHRPRTATQRNDAEGGKRPSRDGDRGRRLLPRRQRQREDDGERGQRQRADSHAHNLRGTQFDEHGRRQAHADIARRHGRAPPSTTRPRPE